MSTAATPDPVLLRLLRCPACLGELTASAGAADDAPGLGCGGCGRVYPVRDGVPILLVDEATGGPDAPASDAPDAPAVDGR